MKLFIGLTLLSVAFAIQPVYLPPATWPVNAGVKVVDLPMHFQTPDISPTIISPEVMAMVDDLQNDDSFGRVEITEPVMFETPVEAVISKVQVADIPEAKVQALPVGVQVVDLSLSVLVADIPKFDAVDAVKLVDEAENSESIYAVRFVDSPTEVENSESVDAVKVVDLPIEAENSEKIDAVRFVDAPIESENESPAVEAVKVADLPLSVDAVKFVDAPLEEAESKVDAPAPSKLERILAKLRAQK